MPIYKGFDLEHKKCKKRKKMMKKAQSIHTTKQKTIKKRINI